MKKQSKSWWCGVASIANALEVLGIRRSQREVARLCHVSPEAGTDETEMKRALLANGVGVDEWDSTRYEGMSPKPPIRSVNWVEFCLTLGRAVILCVDDDEHWVTAIGLCGRRVIVFDPSRNHGIEVHRPASLAARWMNSDGVFYGLGVSLLTPTPDPK